MRGKFVSYLRVSTDKQGQTGYGIDAQRAAVASYLNGGDWQLIGEFVEGFQSDRVCHSNEGTSLGGGRPRLMLDALAEISAWISVASSDLLPICIRLPTK
jgi:DNA invertase Pin-like site-specific DNA recombinase